MVAVIQARMGSSRLPGKTLAKIRGKPLLEWIILRTKQSKTVDEIVLATSGLGRDDEVARLAHVLGCSIYRGEENDVLNRIFEAALAANAEVVVRVCADNPFLDAVTLDDCARAVACGGYDYATNAYSGGAPPGTVSEAISFSALREAHLRATAGGEREHVTPYVRKNRHLFKSYSAPVADWLARAVRLCVDTPADMQFVRKVYSKLAQKELFSQAGLKKAVAIAEKLQPPTIVFLTEARRERGIGHLMRCIAVAKQLRKNAPKRKIHFLLNDGIGKQILRKENFQFTLVKFDTFGVPNASECQKAFSQIGPATVVTDIFLLENDTAVECIPGGSRIIAIDDTGARKMHCHAIVNPTVVQQWHSYEENETFPGQKTYSDAQFMPLNPEVAKLSGKFKLSKQVKKILVTMGGGDEFHKTLAAARAVEKLARQTVSLHATIVVGAGFDAKLRKELVKLTKRNKFLKLIYSPSNLPSLLAASDLVFTAGGVTMYEAAFLGVPQIILPRTREYEGKAAREFEKRGAALVAFEQKQALNCLKKVFAFEKRKKMSSAARKIVDGKGAHRIVRLIA